MDFILSLQEKGTRDDKSEVLGVKCGAMKPIVPIPTHSALASLKNKGHILLISWGFTIFIVMTFATNEHCAFFIQHDLAHKELVGLQL
jgi:hypothetical protein